MLSCQCRRQPDFHSPLRTCLHTYFVAQTRKEQETGWYVLHTPLPCISLQQCGTTVCIHGPGSVYSMTMRCIGSAIQPRLPSIPMSKYKVHDAECMHVWWVVYLFALKWNAWRLGWKWDSRAGLDRVLRDTRMSDMASNWTTSYWLVTNYSGDFTFWPDEWFLSRH